MPAVASRLGQQYLKPSVTAAISSFVSSLNHPYFHHYYGADNPRYASTFTAIAIGHIVRKGTVGRSSFSGIIAAVFGATGFLGRAIPCATVGMDEDFASSVKMVSRVFVPFRGSEDSDRHLKLMGDLGQIVPMKYNPRDENSIKAVMAKANVVIDLVGREYETGNYSFEEVNHHISEQLAMLGLSMIMGFHHIN